MTKFLPFVPPVLRLFMDDALWETFVAHEFWKAHHSSADQKAANDVTLVLLKKNLQFLIDNAATLQDTLGVNFLDPGLQMDLLVRVGYNRRHLHRKLTGTEQEQKWKSLVAAGINTDWSKVPGKDVSIAAWEHFLAQFWSAGNSEAGKLQAHKRAEKPKVEPATPIKQGVTPGDAKTSSPGEAKTPPSSNSPGAICALENQLAIVNKRYDELVGESRTTVKDLRDENRTQQQEHRRDMENIKIANLDATKKLQEEVVLRTNGMVKLEGDLKRNREEKDRAVAEKNVSVEECKKWRGIADKYKAELEKKK